MAYLIHYGGDLYMRRKIICFPEKGKVAIKEEELSEDLENDEILIENLKNLISPGTELALYTGTHVGFKDPKNLWAKYPHYPGYISIGRIVKTGKCVVGLNPDDIVLSSMNHCSHGKLKDSDPLLIKLPENADLDTLLFARMAAISMTAPLLADYSIGDRVAIIGLGIVGNLCSQLFQLSGADVYPLEIVPYRIKIAQNAGINRVLNGGETHEVKSQIQQVTNELGVDIVVEATGIPELVNQALELVNNLGQVILLGSTRGLVNIDVYTHIHHKGITVKGAHANVLDSTKIVGEPNGMRKYILRMIDLILSGRLKVYPLITHRIAPEDVEDAYNWLLKKENMALGIIINWK